MTFPIGSMLVLRHSPSIYPASLSMVPYHVMRLKSYRGIKSLVAENANDCLVRLQNDFIASPTRRANSPRERDCQLEIMHAK